jgi:hypothetical protein
MAVLTTFTSATSGPDAMDTLNSVLAQILALKAAVVPSIVSVAASGTTQTLTGAAGVGWTYDVTLTGNCVFTLAAASAGIYPQLVTLYLRQDATAGRTASFGSVGWASGSAPQLNTSGGAYDVLQFATLDGVKWLGSVLALGVVAPTVPAAPTLTVTPGNASNVLTFIDGAANGSPITSRKLYRGTTAGGETLLGTITLSNGSYTDTGLTNGTTYYYKATTVNAVGESLQSAEVSATPQAIHYLTTAGATSNAASTSTGTPPAGFIEMTAEVTLASFPASGKSWTLLGSTDFFFINGDGTLQVGYNATGTQFPNKSSVLPTSVLGARALLRVGINTSGAAVTLGGVTYPNNQTTYSYSLDQGATMNTLNSVASATALAAGSAGFSVGSGSTDTGAQFKGNIHKAMVRSSAGAAIVNPDFTALASGTTSFTDAAGNAWTVNSPASVA